MFLQKIYNEWEELKMYDYKTDMKTTKFTDVNATDFLSIKNDYDKIIELLKQGKMQELEKHLYDIQMRYIQESLAYNSVNTIMPTSIQENARNCLRFLEQLADLKGFKNITKKL